MSMEENIKSPLNRYTAREYAFALLFAKTFSPEEDADSFYAIEVDNAGIEFGDQADYVHGVFFGVCDRLPEIDTKISEYAKGWAINRLPRTELALMRLSVYEMMAVSDVPKRVALNEAVELAKKYGDEKAPSFVNGVLNNIAHELPDRECDLV